MSLEHNNFDMPRDSNRCRSGAIHRAQKVAVGLDFELWTMSG
jgi:hypothetical protein